MVVFILKQYSKNETYSRLLADELVNFRFVEREKANSTTEYVALSIILLKSVVSCNMLFDDAVLKRSSNLLTALTLKHSRTWQNISILTEKKPEGINSTKRTDNRLNIDIKTSNAGTRRLSKDNSFYRSLRK